MQIKLNAQETKDIIKDYFMDAQGTRVEVTFEKEWEYLGDLRNDERLPKVNINISGETEIMGKKRDFISELSEEELQSIFEYYLEKENIKCVGFRWNCEETYRDDSFTFKGINVIVEKELIKPIKR